MFRGRHFGAKRGDCLRKRSLDLGFLTFDPPKADLRPTVSLRRPRRGRWRVESRPQEKCFTAIASSGVRTFWRLPSFLLSPVSCLLLCTLTRCYCRDRVPLGVVWPMGLSMYISLPVPARRLEVCGARRRPGQNMRCHIDMLDVYCVSNSATVPRQQALKEGEAYCVDLL